MPALLLLLFLPVTAPLTFHQAFLSPTVVHASTSVANVLSVSNVSSCGQLCLRESACGAFVFDSASKRCQLLSWLANLEGDLASGPLLGPTEVWLALERGFGACPRDFSITWRASRYLLADQRKMTWNEAHRQCRERGAKLAEISSESERGNVSKQILRLFAAASRDFYLGGVQAAGAEENAGGFRWFRSQIPIVMSMFHENQPSNTNNRERFVSGWFGSQPVFLLDDLASEDKRFFLCECHTLN